MTCSDASLFLQCNDDLFMIDLASTRAGFHMCIADVNGRCVKMHGLVAPPMPLLLPLVRNRPQEAVRFEMYRVSDGKMKGKACAAGALLAAAGVSSGQSTKDY
mmetsp:Transcript_6085/g.19121  ORF Transcript_6085/g.19121 Transcript_6085/m.19121 type:complete len:103 (-) Transcript_6085:390-698(-)